MLFRGQWRARHWLLISGLAITIVGPAVGPYWLGWAGVGVIFCALVSNHLLEVRAKLGATYFKLGLIGMATGLVLAFLIAVLVTQGGLAGLVVGATLWGLAVVGSLVCVLRGLRAKWRLKQAAKATGTECSSSQDWG